MKAANKQKLSVLGGMLAISAIAGIIIGILSKDISMGIFIFILAYCVINIIHFIDECSEFKRKK